MKLQRKKKCPLFSPMVYRPVVYVKVQSDSNPQLIKKNSIPISLPHITNENGNLLDFGMKLPHQCTETPPFGNYRQRSFKNPSSPSKKKDTHLKRKENEDNRDSSPTIHRRAQHIIKLAPPREILLPNQILEYERDKEPRTIVDARSRWHR